MGSRASCLCGPVFLDVHPLRTYRAALHEGYTHPHAGRRSQARYRAELLIPLNDYYKLCNGDDVDTVQIAQCSTVVQRCRIPDHAQCRRGFMDD